MGSRSQLQTKVTLKPRLPERVSAVHATSTQQRGTTAWDRHTEGKLSLRPSTPRAGARGSPFPAYPQTACSEPAGGWHALREASES